MTQYGVLANIPRMSQFIFCMTETEGRAVSLKNHYMIQNPKFIYDHVELSDDARVGDYYINGKVIPVD